MKNISIRTKIALLITIPLLIVLFFAMQNIYTSYKTACSFDDMHKKVEQSFELSSLMHHLQLERGLSGGYISSKTDIFTSELLSQKTKTDEALQRTSRLFTSKHLQKLQEIREKTSKQMIDFDEVLEYYTTLNLEIFDVISSIRDVDMPLLLRNAIEAYISLLQAKESSGIERALVTHIISNQTSTKSDKTDLQRLQYSKNHSFSSFWLSLEKIDLNKNISPLIDQKLFDKIESMAQNIVLEDSFANANAMNWFIFATDGIDVQNSIIQMIAQWIQEQSISYQQNAQKSMMIMIAVLICVIVAVFAISFVVTKYIYQDIAAMIKQMQIAKDEALATAKAKSIFLATMSHEIRTPLNGMLGFVKLLQASSNLQDKERRYVQTIQSSAEALMTIVNEILDFSKLEKGHIELEMLPFEPLRVFVDTAKLFSSAALEKNITLKSDLDPKIPSSLIGDAFRVRQVISNLLSNAIKFTPNGGVVAMNISVASLDHKKCTLRFEVVDSGIGIKKEKQETIFKAFAQEEASTYRQFGGTGLGLAISAKIIEAMHSKIEIRSQEGEGSCFFFEIEFEIAKIADGKKSILAGLHVGLYCKDEEMSQIPQKLLLYLKQIATIVDISDDIIDSHESYDVVVMFEKHYKKITDEKLKQKTIILTYDAHSPYCNVCEYVRLDKDIYLSYLCNAMATIVTAHTKPIEHFTKQSQLMQKSDMKVLLVEDHLINQELMSALFELRGIQSVVANNGKEAFEIFQKERFDLVLMDINMPVLDGMEATKLIRAYENQKAIKKTPIVALTANIFKEDIDLYKSLGMDDALAKPLDEKLFDEIIAKYTHKQETLKKQIVTEEIAKKLSLPPNVIEKIIASFVKTTKEDIKSLHEAIKADDAQTIRELAHKIKGAAKNLHIEPIGDITASLENAGKEANMQIAKKLIISLDEAYEAFAALA